jgi:arylsulfatase A-like enzyme
MRLASLWTVALLFGIGDVPAFADRPSILFFLSDDHRAGFLGCAGHPVIRTPEIDRLALSGVRFENAFVTTSICAASRASILTGVVERTHRFTFGTPPLARTFTDDSYPRLLRDNGYRTGFVGKFGVNVEAGQSAEMFDSFTPIHRSPYFQRQPDGTLRHETALCGDRAIEFLRGTPIGQPFCLSVSFNAAHAEDADHVKHYPWLPELDGLYDDVEIGPPRLSSDDIFAAHPEFLKESFNRDRWYWRWDTPEKYQHNIRAYYRQISGIDFTIGRVLRELERLGRAEETVVIFSGDNGYYAGERQFTDKWSHYEQSQRVPLVVHDPRAGADARGRVKSEIVLNLDIPATILNGEQPADWRTDFFCEHLMDQPRIPKWEGVRTTRYKYACYFEQQPPYEFLHDLEHDPDELRNLVDDPSAAAVLGELRARTHELRVIYGPEATISTH